MIVFRRRLRICEKGQSLIELALVLPVLLMIVFNALNFGYFYLVTVNLSAASRSATLYSIQGQATPATLIPAPATPNSTVPACPSYNTSCWVTNTAYTDLKLPSATTATVQVCSENLGVISLSSTDPTCPSCPVAKCQQGSGTSFSNNGTAIPDPKGPAFVLQQVDIWYTFQPLIPGTIFNIATPCGSGNCQFHRVAQMRAMN